MTETEDSIWTMPVAPNDVKATETLAARAELILSALEAGQSGMPTVNRRAVGRERLRVCGFLRLFADGAGASAKPIFTRDANSRGMGFVTPHRLPLGYGGVIEIPNRFGRKTEIHCTLLRAAKRRRGGSKGHFILIGNSTTCFRKAADDHLTCARAVAWRRRFRTPQTRVLPAQASQ